MYLIPTAHGAPKMSQNRFKSTLNCKKESLMHRMNVWCRIFCSNKHPKKRDAFSIFDFHFIERKKSLLSSLLQMDFRALTPPESKIYSIFAICIVIISV